MENLVYSEWVPNGTFFKVTLLSVASAITLVLVNFVLFVRPINSEVIILIGACGAFLGFLLFWFLNFRGIKVQITEKELTVYFGLLNKKAINLENISSCTVSNTSFGKYGRVGVRDGFDDSTAYMTFFGKAVEILDKNGRTFVFSSNQPERICKNIATKKKNVLING